MSHYADYVRERLGDEVLETKEGFVTYQYLDSETVYIKDIYVCSDFRRDHVASCMADAVVETAKKQGCKKLVGTVVPSTNGSTESLKVLLGYGMKLDSSANDLIVFKKEF